MKAIKPLNHSKSSSCISFTVFPERRVKIDAVLSNSTEIILYIYINRLALYIVRYYDVRIIVKAIVRVSVLTT